MSKSPIPVYQKQKGSLKINELFSIKWKKTNSPLYKGVEKPHRHDYFSLLFLMAGETTQFVDFKEYLVKRPTILLMHPDQVHVDVESQDATILLITFHENLLLASKESPSWMDIFRKTLVPMDPKVQQEFSDYIYLMEMEYANVQPSERVIAFLLSALLEKIKIVSEISKQPEESSKNAILVHFKQLVETHALSEVEVSFYAKKLYISAGHLNDMIKSLSGRNAKSFINERRILEAKRLLFWTETSIQDVAWKTGFKDPAYFSRFFKKHTGFLPGVFQKQSQKQSHKELG